MTHLSNTNAENDLVDVDDTEHVGALIKKLSDGKRQMIVTTRQKMQIMVNKRLKKDTPQYNRIKSLKVAFVVDECHRAVTPQTKRELEKMIGKRHSGHSSGFTGDDPAVFFYAFAAQKKEFQKLIEGRVVFPYLLKSGQDQLRNDRRF